MNKTQSIIKIISLIILILLVIFFIIPNRNKRQINTDISNIQATTTYNFELKKINYNTDFYDIEAVYENHFFDNQKLIEKQILKDVNQVLEEWKIGGDIQKEEENLNKQFPDRPKIKYQYSVDYHKYDSGKMNMISYVFYNYMFTGGAHGNTYLNTFVFDKNGLVKINDLLDLKNNINDIKITRLIYNKIKDNHIVNESAHEMLIEGLGLNNLDNNNNYTGTQDKKFSFKDNLTQFIVLDEGIIFIFDQYQIAPYIDGNPEVLLTWDELKPYMINK